MNYPRPQQPECARGAFLDDTEASLQRAADFVWGCHEADRACRPDPERPQLALEDPLDAALGEGRR